MNKEKSSFAWIASTLWILYCFGVGWILFMALLRLASLTIHGDFRKNIDTSDTFPSACGSWAAANGCTRLTLQASGCVRQDSPDYDLLTYSNSWTTAPATLNYELAQCIDKADGAKLEYPEDL